MAKLEPGILVTGHMITLSAIRVGLGQVAMITVCQILQGTYLCAEYV